MSKLVIGVAACLATLRMGAEAATVHQPGAGQVQDVVMAYGKVVAATSPDGIALYDQTRTPPRRIASAETGFSGKRVSCRFDTCVAVANGADAGMGAYDIAGGTRVEGIGWIPGNFTAAAVSSNDEMVYGGDYLYQFGQVYKLRRFHRNGGPHNLEAALPAWANDIVVCGGQSNSMAGSRVYVTTSYDRRVLAFDGATLTSLATSANLGAETHRLACDGSNVWVATQTRSVLLRGSDLTVVRDNVPVLGRHGYALIGSQLFGVQYSVVTGFDVLTSVPIPAFSRNGELGVAGLGDGWLWTGNATKSSIIGGLWGDTVGMPGPVTIPPTVPPTLAAATHTRPPATSPPVAPNTSTPTHTAYPSAPTCAPGCVVGACGP